MSAAWQRFRDHFWSSAELGLSLDVSCMRFPDEFLSRMAEPMKRAFHQMEALESGAIANPDEKRRVGHYWLRAPSLAPDDATRHAITDALERIRTFAVAVRTGSITGTRGPFRHLLIVGIGGSALGPQLVSSALSSPDARCQAHFIDNTDPDGIDRVLASLDDRLEETLTIVISKSGGTKETRNGMLEVARAYQARGLAFARHAVAVTGEDSELDRVAIQQDWLARFPMWDWVGGRTSELSAVGLLPAALEGIDIDVLLDGARHMDEVTRVPQIASNPAAQLALMWFHAGDGRGKKDMVILPYKDRLSLLSRYLQQLVMESVGKARDLDGNVVHQGLAVYGNKGSTDQHAYVQQLRDGLDNFFVTFVQVLRDRDGASMEVEPGVTSGDYLFGFLEGTRRALAENGRESMTLTIDRVDARRVGALLALFERAVGFYASLIHVNAYHQPGVEAGKKAASEILQLKARVIDALSRATEKSHTAEELAKLLGVDDVETIWKICEHAAANPDRGVEKIPNASAFSARYRKRS